MKKYTLFISCLVLSLFLCGCDKDDDPTSSSKAEYYIKYEGKVTTNGTYGGTNGVYYGKVNYIVNTESGTENFESTSTFSQTFGPVKKGFTANITIDAVRSVTTYCNAKIYVSRNNEPFALKANKMEEKTVTVSYTIDY
ncbi:MAG: hypothetical protein K2I94_07585 [Muribaculaceae bacterium]|nr:hypothetical protein [Muribaculaceae bacterium]